MSNTAKETFRRVQTCMECFYCQHSVDQNTQRVNFWCPEYNGDVDPFSTCDEWVKQYGVSENVKATRC